MCIRGIRIDPTECHYFGFDFRQLSADVRPEIRPVEIMWLLETSGTFDSFELSIRRVGDIVKFDRAAVIEYILDNEPSEGRFMTVTLSMTGRLYNGTPFQGSDAIRLILPMSRCGRLLELLYFT